jgi:hypothetical protein
MWSLDELDDLTAAMEDGNEAEDEKMEVGNELEIRVRRGNENGISTARWSRTKYRKTTKRYLSRPHYKPERW